MLSQFFSVGRAFLRVPNLFAILMSLMLPPSCSSYHYFVVFNKKTQIIRQYIFVLLSVFFDRFFLQKKFVNVALFRTFFNLKSDILTD